MRQTENDPSRYATWRKAKADLEPPELPYCVEHLWRWFCELHLGRGTGGFGPSRVTYADIDAWSRLTRTQVRPAEVRAILAVDNEWLRVQVDSQPKPSKPKAERPKR